MEDEGLGAVAVDDMARMLRVNSSVNALIVGGNSRAGEAVRNYANKCETGNIAHT